MLLQLQQDIGSAGKTVNKQLRGLIYCTIRRVVPGGQVFKSTMSRQRQRAGMAVLLAVLLLRTDVRFHPPPGEEFYLSDAPLSLSSGFVWDSLYIPFRAEGTTDCYKFYGIQTHFPSENLTVYAAKTMAYRGFEPCKPAL